ncbi:MAG: magnesium chelatase domain-containing protein, partial [Saccharopolyspora rectivirgula]
AVTVMVEGKRPLLVEVQALAMRSPMAMPRRSVSGLDSSRVAMMLAVLEKHGKVHFSNQEVYAATVGGTKVTEPAADLAIALALASSNLGKPLPPGVIAVGEVGLAGEIRRVTGLNRRLAEAARLGFDRALVPPDSGPLPDGIRTTEVPDIRTALKFLRQGK